jgi:hypothetical protein
MARDGRSPNRYVAPQYPHAFDNRTPRDGPEDMRTPRGALTPYDGPMYPSAVLSSCRKCGRPYSPQRKR